MLDKKHEKLKDYIKTLGSVVIAFSGGVDSSFLLKVAHDVLGQNVVAVTARSSTYPEREYLEAVEFADSLGVKHVTIVSEELEVEGFSGNPLNRCYLCKKELFTKLAVVAKEHNIEYIAEGSNIDDLGDYRPGLTAVSELGVVSPLRAADLTKDDIRALLKEMGLKVWNKPSFACLSSRFPYGDTITVEKLQMIDKAEQALLDLGFSQVRVRFENNSARIELNQDEISKIIEDDNRQKIYSQLKSLGFQNVSLDLRGYRSGSMNENIAKT